MTGKFYQMSSLSAMTLESYEVLAVCILKGRWIVLGVNQRELSIEPHWRRKMDD